MVTTSAPHTDPAPAGTAGVLGRLIGEARGVRSRLVLAAFLGALASGCAVALMAASAWLIARAAQQPPVLYLLVAVTGVRAFGIGRGVFRYLERLVSHDAAFRVLGRLRERLMAQLARLAPAGLPVWRRGDLLARLVDDVQDTGDAFLRGLLPIAGAVLVGGGTVVLSFLILPAAGAALLVSLLVAGALAPALSARRTARTEREVVRLRGERSRLVGEMLDDAAELAVLGAFDDRLAELDELAERNRLVTARTARTAGIAAGLATLAMGAAVWLATVAGVPAVVQGDLAPVLLAVVVLTPLALIDVVQAVILAAGTLRRSAASADRVFGVLAARPVVPDGPTDPRPLPDPAAGVAVRVRDLAVRWPGSGRDAVSGLDLDLRPGRRIVLLGESGSGKSTVLAALLGFLPVRSGRFTVGPDGASGAGGTPVDQLDPETVRGLFGWCDHHAYLFDSTIVENVRLARPGATDEDVHAALRGAGAGDWVDGLPDGLHTRVGQHGLAVSGGQRQRLAIARALLADRPFLLADEPAASLDRPIADAVTATIMRPDPRRCVVLVSHRPQDVEFADEVLEMADGRVVRRYPGPRAD
ncbi:thiol reductant ABC exporter subunit CydC [Nakamurella flava]|uniref:Thiol reductant ABC exporter subunit CydC n=1 Tax=Nakamurella flava TaxID=2576308 RepID=A0A4U6QIL4_9ACTN|nr:thiol reductant ABC exporter subunit CydC [Nakamurella flava]TKV60247.1 thiol reductant ABC exporter subunit CydC [Nakamurella flava]